jgi:hypothetical protein
MPRVLKRSPGTRTFEHHHSQSTYSILPENGINKYHCKFLFDRTFPKKDYKVLSWRITERREDLENPLFITMAPRSSTKKSEMDMKGKFWIIWPTY